MEPTIWGPPAWIFLHTITLNYPHKPTMEEKNYYKHFFLNLENVLPCTYCAHNYKIHLQKYPIEKFLDSKKNLVQWLIHIHNEVNKIFNKKIISYEEFITIYKKIYNKNQTNYFTYFIFSIVFIIIFILLFILIKFRYYFHRLFFQKTLYSIFRQ